jgi:protein phosphatase
MNYVLGHAQHQGDRGSQQDAFGFIEPSDPAFEAHAGKLVIVADGMGGMEHGDIASQTAVQCFLDSYRKKTPEEPIPAALERALLSANQAVVDFAQQAGCQDGTGTTFIAAVLHGDRLHWISVGDSHLYLFRNRKLHLLSHPHVFANLLARAVAAGHLSQEEANRHPERESLTSYIGSSHLEEIDRHAGYALQPGDSLILASDGLFKTLSEDEIVANLTGDPQTWAPRLVERTIARRRPQQDNVTVVTVTLPGPAPEESTINPHDSTVEMPNPGIAPPPEVPSDQSQSTFRGALWWFPLILVLLSAALIWYLSQSNS